MGPLWCPYIKWKPYEFAYGLVESAHILQLLMDEWLGEAGLYKVPVLPQLLSEYEFIQSKSIGRIQLALCEVVDDILITGAQHIIERFCDTLSILFKFCPTHVDQEVIFNNIRIKRSCAGKIIYGMDEYFHPIQLLNITPHRRKEPIFNFTNYWWTTFLCLIRFLNLLGNGVLLQACLVDSILQQLLSKLTDSSLNTTNKMLEEFKQLTASTSMVHPSNRSNPCYLAFSDPSQGKSSYGQTGCISTIYSTAGRTFRSLNFQGCKKSLVAFSSIGLISLSRHLFSPPVDDC